MLVGFLLWATFLARRHYAYSIVALLVVTAIFATGELLRMHRSVRSIAKELLADVIVVTSGDSVHLGAEHQRVVTLPSQALFDSSTPIGSAYVMNKTCASHWQTATRFASSVERKLLPTPAGRWQPGWKDSCSVFIPR